MSSELIFRKGKAELLSYVGSSKIYEVLHNYVSYDKWSEVKEHSLNDGLETLHEKRDYYISQINKHKEALDHLKNTEDIYTALDNIEEIAGELEETEIAIIELKLIKEIQDYIQYDEKEGRIEIPLEWMVC